jgi:serine/threonine protein kinase
VAAVEINTVVQPNSNCDGINNEPRVIKSILFSMQGDHVHDEFQLDTYLNHWKLRLPQPKMRYITIAKTDFELRDFGGAIEPFLHKATIDMLSNAQMSDWLDLKTNNSFLIHLAIAMNKVPLALHTAFARNCARNAQTTHDSAWIPGVLASVFPSTSNLQIMILSKSSENEMYISERYGYPGHGGGTTLESSVVLMRDGKDYSWLKNVSIDDVKVKTFHQKFQNDVKRVSFKSLMMRSVLIEGCHTKKEAPSNEKKVMWNTACGKLGLQQQESGRWIVRPQGVESNLTFQDGSLTPKSFENLMNTLTSKKVNCTTVIDFGSEAGHAVAQFAFKPFVQQVTGIEIQFAWAAHSAIILQQICSQCRDKGYHFADTRIIHGSFLSTQKQNPEWITALKSAHLCFCNNVNWDKGKVNIASEQRRVKNGDYKNSINANLAMLLADELERNSHAVVFDATHYSSQAYEKVQTLQVQATWNTIGQSQVQVLRIRPYQFKDFETAMRALCQDKNCNFDELPREWLKNRVQSDVDVNFVTLKDHVMRTNHFAKSNATVHEGWSVTPARVVCIKKFAQATVVKNVDREIEILELLAQSDDASSHNVIRYIGTDEDRRCGKVLIFERVHASNFNSQLESLTAGQVAKYMYKLLQSLHYLHSHGVVHRDLKPSNFLHNFESDTFRLIDFGSAVTGTDVFGKKGGGTQGFKAPEFLTKSDSQTSSVDIWSAGIILFSLLTGKKHVLSERLRGDKACEASHLREIGEIVGTTKMKQWNVLQSDEYGNGCRYQNKTGWAAKALQTVIAERSWKPDDQALDLLSQMLEVDPTKRIETLAALEHPFLEAKKEYFGVTNKA